MNYKAHPHLLARVALAITAGPARAHDGETSLAATVDSLDALPEAARGFYTERDGKFHLNVTGLPSQADVTRLNEALRKERLDHKTVKDQLNTLTQNGARKIEDVLADLDRIPELEASQGQIDEEKLNTLVESRLKTRMGPVERQLNEANTKLAERDTTISAYEAKDRTRTIHDTVREAATKAKLLPEAVEDALLLADRTMEVDESGNVVTKDGVGVTPGIQPSAWLTDMQSKRPHWWGPSSGGGAGGQRGNNGDTNTNPFTHDNWNLTEQGVITQRDPQRAEQLAKLAGTTIGGERPAKR